MQLSRVHLSSVHLSCVQRFAIALLVAMGFILLLTGCGPSEEDEVASATATLPAPTTAPTTAPPTVIEFWTTDNQEGRLKVYNDVAQRFMQSHPEIDLRIVGKDEATIANDVEAAAAENRLPALLRIGVERLPTLAVKGLLDEQAASSVIRTIGIDDFRAGPLEMVTNLESNQQWAIPYDGWIQALWYRRDIFEAQGLSAAGTWEQINAACDTLSASANTTETVSTTGTTTTTATTSAIQYGLALPSDPTQNYAHQVFEQIAISNNAWPLTLDGKAAFATPEMIEALRFYTALQRCSAPGPLNAPQAADHYLRGEVAMLFYSTYIMDDLVEGAERDGNRVMPVLEDLAQRTSFASGMVGPGGSAAYGQVVALALLQGADPVAQEVAKFFLTDGYVEILATTPLGKIPVRQSVAERWTELDPIFANYSPATLGHIVNGYDTLHRWILRGGYTNSQRAVISEIENELLVPQAIDRILRGEMTPESAAGWLQAQTEALLAATE